MSTIVIAIGCYLAVLVAAGWWADRAAVGVRARRFQPLFYGLSLATLSSAWTYFGGVGDAGNGSWLYAANALGPILAITLGYPVWRRIAVLSKQENVGSLADFLAARYGKSRALGILTACVASLGALPYIALQLSVLTRVWAFATGTRAPGGGGGEALGLIALLAGIAIAFGTRRPSLTQHNRGFVRMIAIEACVKLSGLLGVAGLAIVLFARAPDGLHRALAALPPVHTASAPTFLTLVVLCTVTAFTLPRQFHLGFVTLEREGDIRGAVWVVPVYFGLWALATLIIALAIRAGAGMPGGDPYMQLLAVPMRHGSRAIALLALLGGLSAGAAMVVVETTAISAMVSNEIVLPLFARSMRQRLSGENIGGSILLVRRVTILAIAALALLYDLGIGGSQAPTALGLTALTAFAQLLPALIGGIYWRGGHARGAIAGICAGMAVWAGAIAAPAFLPGAAPRLAGDVLWGALPHFGPVPAIFTSLAANIALFVAMSLRATPRLIDTIQANSFVAQSPRMPAAAHGRIAATVGDLRRLLAQFLGAAETDRALLGLRAPADGHEVSPNLVRAAERLLAGVIGAPSARNVIALALAAETQDARDISRILDEAGHAVHFSRELLQTTLDSLPQGVSVVDEGQQLVAWNARFLQLLDLPVTEVHVGKSLPDLLAAAERPLRRHIAARLATMAGHRPFQDEIAGNDGRVLRLAGLPLTGGDYLATLADITDLKQAEQVLARSNEDLERRVEERTRELAAAKQVAEHMTGAQQRFVAAASHDLVQPLHAARLFIGNALVGAEADNPLVPLLQRADQAVEGAHRLLRALLNLSQLEIGALHPRLEAVDAGALLAALAGEFAAEAATRGLELVLLPTTAWVRSDRDLLRSMLQNLVLNALRYTARGRVVIVPRRAGGHLRFEVRDSGVGIAPENLPAAFGEYSRLSEGRAMAGGAGLGLSIVARIAHVLDHPLAVRSRPGAGSVFSVTVPITAPAHPAPRLPQPPVDLAGLRVLCVDDERDVLFGTGALIERWGGVVLTCESAEAALAAGGAWDVAIADYHLGGADGLSLLRALAGRVGTRLLVTALPADNSLAALAQEGIVLLAKPVAPLALRAILVEAAGRPPATVATP